MLVPFILALAKYNAQNSPFNFKSNKNHYTFSSSPNGEFATNNESNIEDDNAFAIIEELFWNIRYRFLYEKLTKKIVKKTFKFFIYSLRHMPSKDQIAFCGIKLDLRSF